ncbi:MAG: 3-methyl-2-oxobutanoate dehydrogenase [Deltaproteobacteria bacterium]|nr:3-methyl-2-oxobutanoate dehydrogenase [Deltaproteobacteria bacterium]
MSDRPDEDEALGLLTVLRDDGGADAATAPFLEDDLLRAMHREMLRIRVIDERMLMRQRQGRVGFFGTITGQEATPIATGFATEARDWVFPALRESAIMLVRGFPLEAWLAQAYGNEADVLKGRQMPSHMSGRSVNQVSWSSVIGPQITQAVGAAMAAKLRGDDVVTVGFMGDGATSEGDFHSAMTMASRFRAPCVLICQNNHWSISVPTAKQTRSQTIAVKARAYGMPGVRVDGNDVLAVYSAVKQAADRARAGEGPTFIESVTYRMGPHSSSDDPSRYRSDEEVAEWAKKDPVERFERYLARAEVVSPEQAKAVREDLTTEVLETIKRVEVLAPMDRRTLFEDLYQDLPQHHRDQAAALEAGPRAPSH